MNKPALNSLGCSMSQLCRSFYGSLSAPWLPLLSLPTLPCWVLSVNGLLSHAGSKPCHHFSFLPPSSTHIQLAAGFGDTASCINFFFSPVSQPPSAQTLFPLTQTTALASHLGCLQAGSLPPICFPCKVRGALSVRFLMARFGRVSPILKSQRPVP